MNRFVLALTAVAALLGSPAAARADGPTGSTPAGSSALGPEWLRMPMRGGGEIAFNPASETVLSNVGTAASPHWEAMGGQGHQTLFQVTRAADGSVQNVRNTETGTNYAFEGGSWRSLGGVPRRAPRSTRTRTATTRPGILGGARNGSRASAGRTSLRAAAARFTGGPRR